MDQNWPLFTNEHQTPVSVLGSISPLMPWAALALARPALDTQRAHGGLDAPSSFQVSGSDQTAHPPWKSFSFHPPASLLPLFPTLGMSAPHRGTL